MKRTIIHWALCSAVYAMTAAGATHGADPNLVGWWNFDESPGPTGTAFDASGNDNHGTLHGGVQWVAHQTGGALKFDGKSGYVGIPFSESLRLLNAGDLTFAAWFQADAIPSAGDQEVFQQGDVLLQSVQIGRTWLLATNGTGEIQTFLGGGSTLSGVIAGPGRWFHAAVVVTEGGATDTIQVYVDGKAAGAPGQRGMETCDGPYFIGCHKKLRNFWAGLIDDVRLYDRALSAAEIESLAAVPPKLKAHSPNPPDGDAMVVAPLLEWTAGDTAVLHDVYLGTALNLGPNDLVQAHSRTTKYYHDPGLTLGTTYFWRVDEIEADMTTVHTGDVWTFTARPFTAYLPTPADGENEVSPDPNVTLTWQPGMLAVEHHLYFGDSFDDVNSGAADTDKGIRAETAFAPGGLDAAAVYFWRVDEIAADGAIRTGPVWRFATYRAVDDFESYTDEPGQKIYQTWIDGYGYTDPQVVLGNGSGATVGHAQPPFAEQRVVHGGKQSMPMDYNNVGSPFYSEAGRTFAPPTDWRVKDVDTLVLYIRGRTVSAQGTLHIAIEDASGQMGIITHPDPAVVTAAQWTKWKIPLGNSTGVDWSKITKMYIGVGERDSLIPDGKGRLYIDDIRLTRSATDAGAE